MRFINALVACSVIAITSTAGAQVARPLEWTTASGGNGHWYGIVIVPSNSWNQCLALARASGGDLASLTSAEEHAFVGELAQSVPQAFVGPYGPFVGGFQDPSASDFSEPSGGWRWSDGEPWGFQAWFSGGEPSNCLGLCGGGCLAENFIQLFGPEYQGTWNDIHDAPDTTCGAQGGWIVKAYVVEYSADCNNDGIVDYGQCLNGTLPDYNGNNIPDCCERGEVCVTGNYPVQWRVADGGNGHWYQLRIRSSVVPWSSAATESVASAGHLASILSEAEDIFTFNVANHPGAWQGYLGPWLGGRQVPGTGEPLGIWEWSSGEPWGYVGPDSSFPNNGGPPGTDENRLHYIDFVRKWNDIPENGCPENGGGVRAMIVEWEADCNNDGVVDYGQILSGQLIDANSNNIPDCCESGTACESQSSAVQWTVASGGNGHWYKVVNLAGTGKVDWSNSRASAIDIGGDLACFTSEAETSAFLSLTAGQTRGNPWIGLFQDHSAPDFSEPAGGWRWASGEPLMWTNWAAGEPNNAGNEDWVNMWIDYGPRGTWNDYRPTNPQGPDGFIIEWSADCNNDGIVDKGQILSGQLIDANANGVPDVCELDPCPGDISGNNKVDGVDLAALLGTWGTNGQGEFNCDVDHDGIVGGTDLTIILGGWGPCPN